MFEFVTRTGVELRDLTKKQRIMMLVGISCFIVSIMLSLFAKIYYAIILIIPLISLIIAYYKCLHRKYIIEVPISMNFRESSLDIEISYAIVINKKGFSVLYSFLYSNVKKCLCLESEGKIILRFDGQKIAEKKINNVRDEVIQISFPSKYITQIIEACKSHISCFEIVKN